MTGRIDIKDSVNAIAAYVLLINRRTQDPEIKRMGASIILRLEQLKIEVGEVYHGQINGRSKEMTLRQLAKSDTIKFNMIVPAIVAVLRIFGIEVPADVVTGALVLSNFANIGFRVKTKEAISDK